MVQTELPTHIYVFILANPAPYGWQYEVPLPAWDGAWHPWSSYSCCYSVCLPEFGKHFPIGPSSSKVIWRLSSSTLFSSKSFSNKFVSLQPESVGEQVLPARCLSVVLVQGDSVCLKDIVFKNSKCINSILQLSPHSYPYSLQSIHFHICLLCITINLTVVSRKHTTASVLQCLEISLSKWNFIVESTKSFRTHAHSCLKCKWLLAQFLIKSRSLLKPVSSIYCPHFRQHSDLPDLTRRIFWALLVTFSGSSAPRTKLSCNPSTALVQRPWKHLVRELEWWPHFPSHFLY